MKSYCNQYKICIRQLHCLLDITIGEVKYLFIKEYKREFIKFIEERAKIILKSINSNSIFIEIKLEGFHGIYTHCILSFYNKNDTLILSNVILKCSEFEEYIGITQGDFEINYRAKRLEELILLINNDVS